MQTVASQLALACVVFFVLVDQHRAFGQSPTDCELSQQLRAGLGLGPAECAALELSEGAMSNIVGAADDFLIENRQQIEPLLETVQSARLDLMRTFERDPIDFIDPDQFEGTPEELEIAAAAARNQACSNRVEDLDEALGTLFSACGSLVTSVNSHLTQGQQTKVARRRAHPQLDPCLAMLDLSSQQAEELTTLTLTRNRITVHHKNRTDGCCVSAAQETFDSAANAILTGQQESETAVLKAAQISNHVAVAQFEEQTCPQE